MLTLEQATNQLNSQGITVVRDCGDVNALGWVWRKEMNVIYNCAAGRHAVTTLTHEGIHLLQFRMGEEELQKLLVTCDPQVEHHAGIRASKWEDSGEAQAYRYEATECAQEVVLTHLTEYIPPPPPPPPVAQDAPFPFGLWLAFCLTAAVGLGLTNR